MLICRQTLKLQESPENVPTGEMPRHMLIAVDRSTSSPSSALDASLLIVPIPGILWVVRSPVLESPPLASIQSTRALRRSNLALSRFAILISRSALISWADSFNTPASVAHELNGRPWAYRLIVRVVEAARTTPLPRSTSSRNLRARPMSMNLLSPYSFHSRCSSPVICLTIIRILRLRSGATRTLRKPSLVSSSEAVERFNLLSLLIFIVTVYQLDLGTSRRHEIAR